MELIPKDTVKEVVGGELTIDKKKHDEMLAKAKELFDKPIEYKELMDKLEQYYVFEKNQHFTSEQLKSIVDELATTETADLPVAEDIKL